jgi:O-antigen/teichoic acid export membrane protein
MSIFRSFSAGMLVQMLGMLGSLAAQIVGARLLGASGFGRYASLVAVANFVVIFAKLERDSVVVRFIATADSPTRVSGIIRWAIIRTAQQAVLVGSLVGSAYLLLSRNQGFDTRATLLGLILAVVGASLIAVCTAVFQSTNRAVTGLAYPNVLRPVLLLSLFVGLGTLRSAPNEEVFFIANGLAALATLCVMLWKLRYFALPAVWPSDGKMLHSAGISITAISFAQILLSTQLDILVLSRVASSADVGRYAAAAQFAALAGVPSSILAAVTMAKFAKLYELRDTQKLELLSKAFTSAGSFSSSLIACTLIVAAEPMMTAIGREFKPDTLVMILLCGAQVMSASIGVQSGYLLTMTGRHTLAARLIGAAAAANVLLLLIGASRGPVGVALATLVGTSLRGGLLLFSVKRELGVSIIPTPSTVSQIWRHLKSEVLSWN